MIYDRASALIKSNNKQNIVIVGGGATGVSLAGALSDFIKDNKNRQSFYNNYRSTANYSFRMG
jgi:NADH dehydrogenase FAD-containing subunit